MIKTIPKKRRPIKRRKYVPFNNVIAGVAMEDAKAGKAVHIARTNDLQKPIIMIASCDICKGDLVDVDINGEAVRTMGV